MITFLNMINIMSWFLFSLTIAMLIGWFIIGIFIDVKENYKNIYFNIIKWSFVLSVLLWVLYTSLQIFIK